MTKLTDKLAPQTRSLRVDAKVDDESRTMSFPFSSEEPCDMWYGQEVLSHERGAMREGSRQASMPLLFNHDRNDLLGVVESISIDGKRGVCNVRFGKDERGEWALQQARDGILVNASFMYRVYAMQEGEDDTYTATDWEPFEVSLVTVPADPTVGVGRSADGETNSLTVFRSSTTAEAATKEESMTQATQAAAAAAPVVDVNVDAIRAEASKAERLRMSEIDAMCRSHKVPEEVREGLIREGASIESARGAVLSHLEKTGKQQSLSNPTPDVSKKEAGEYSLMRALQAQLTGDWSKAGFEREVQQTMERGQTAQKGGIFVPDFAMRNSSLQNVGTPNAGGNLVATNLMADKFIEALYPNSAFVQAGIQHWGGLVGNVDIPKQTSTSNAGWIGEDQDATDTNITVGKLNTMSPKTLAASTTISRNALLQTTPAIEVTTRSDMLRKFGLAIDFALGYGKGTQFQPLGIANQTGTHAIVSGGSITIEELIDMETAIRMSNVNGDLQYITNPKVIAALKKLTDKNGRYLWTNFLDAKGGTANQINGTSIYSSTNVASNGYAGFTNSHLFMGDFSQVIMGTWGAMEVTVNPYKYSKSGALEINMFQSMDFAVRHPEAFSIITDLTY